MESHNLPTEDLKTYGIINEDLTFSTKLSPDDVQKFLLGYKIVADNDRNRATFQLTDNNTQLKVIFLERDKSLAEILEQSKEKVQYTDIIDLSKSTDQWNIEKKAFIFDKEIGKTVEFDFIKNATELTAIIADQKDWQELSRYKGELQNLKNYLYDKLDQYPEIAKEIANDLNIVSREIDSVNSISNKQIAKSDDSKIQLNVNDTNRYKYTNRMRENEEQQREEKRKVRR
ncbi:hypothetical protein [Epilithonimonas mollis]|uniref:Uncharacterized protein n=1 Tax=Epilithonimonas mollis TaxID=216903 RepID=A0A1M6UW29_9FLAO|nr:hypothetical protein [Epilithonimonas mollis]SHK73399.1 hypothetical protein SAMN05444371_3490 [Epilithonimonas mollis]